MHDRGDYKTGWQLEREWDEQQKIKVADRVAGIYYYHYSILFQFH
jgi:RING finger protein 113A